MSKIKSRIPKNILCAITATASAMSFSVGGVGVNYSGINVNTENTVSAAGVFNTFSLSETELKMIASLCQQEQGTPRGAAAEASLMANKFENQKTYSDFVKYVRECRWWANAETFMNKMNASNETIAAVRSVLIDGKRTLPAYIDEHDCLSDISSCSNDGVSFSKTDKSKYIQFKTKISNKMKSNYTFYCFPDSNSDPFGYISEERRSMLGDSYYDFDTGELVNATPSTFLGDEDKSYNCPISAVAKRKCNTYDVRGNIENNRWIDAGDQCTIICVYKNGYVYVEYPSGNTTRKAYAESDVFDLTPVINSFPGNEDASYNCPRTATAIRKCNTFDDKGNVESNRWIDAGDKCTIKKVYNTGYVYVEYPSGSQKRTAYAELSNFELDPVDIPTSAPIAFPGEEDTSYNCPRSATAIKKCNTFDDKGNVESNRWIDAGDKCTIKKVFNTGYVYVEYPSGSQKRTAYAELSNFELDPVDIPTSAPIAFPGEEDTSYNCPRSATAIKKCNTFDDKGNVESNRWIDAGDKCTIKKVFNNGYVYVEYPSGSQKRTAYAELSNFELDPVVTPTSNTSSPMEAAINWAISIANDDSHGYCMAHRNGPDYDCSSLVAYALKNAGIYSGEIFGTGKMKELLPMYGFSYVSGTLGIQRCDILWREGHTEIYLGDGKTVGAHGYEDYFVMDANGNIVKDENGFKFGIEGDQNGKEIDVRNTDLSKWEGYFRYNGNVIAFPGEEDNSYKCPLSATANKKCNTYNENGVVETNRWIDKGDKCTILNVYQNGYAYVEYPSGATTRKAFAEIGAFDIEKDPVIEPSPSPLDFPGAVDDNYNYPIQATANKKCDTFDENGNKENNRWIDRGDVCTIYKIYKNGYVYVEYPSGATTRKAYAKLENFTFESVDEVLIGDLNDSNTIDITDLTLLSIHLIDKTDLTEKQKLAADTDGDGIVSLTDLATLRQYLSKAITKLGK